MYVSKYYTCEEIDQRLLQGYYDDLVTAGFAGTLNEFWAFILSIKNKVDKREGYDLSKNDFTDELKRKLDGIEEKANYITKVSQLENDSKFQTEEEVKKTIDDVSNALRYSDPIGTSMVRELDGRITVGVADLIRAVAGNQAEEALKCAKALLTDISERNERNKNA